jgi:UDP-N-acetylglucosamine 2-epimerase (non-hydrolysing)
MKRPRVMTVVGTRPEIIKLSRVIAELRARTDHVLVHTGQNYAFELNGIFFRDLGIPAPDHFLEVAGGTACEAVGRVIAGTEALIGRLKPDAFLVLGDTNSALSVYAAKRRRVPVFHMEAGNRCFDERVPEEINRRVVDHLSDVNLVYTEHARRYLLREGLRAETVIKTGSPMREVLAHYRGRIEASTVLARLKLEAGGYLVVSAHREENVDSPERLALLIRTLNAVVRAVRRPAVFSTHPRTRKRLKALRGVRPDPRIRFLDPLGLTDFVRLQQKAHCVLSDSGTLTEEAAIVGFPAVMLRDQHERPEGMDEATAVLAGLETERVLQAVALATSPGSPLQAPEDYASDNVSRKVVRLILSHIDYVNRTVWRR